jgi:hypothetical protein
MKTKEQIERRLKTLETALENFKMDGETEAIEVTKVKIEMLKWVLES